VVMNFSPAPFESITIDGKSYSFFPDSGLPDQVYCLEGHRSNVYELQGQVNEHLALKVYDPVFQNPQAEAIAAALAPYSVFPGLKVARRTVLTEKRHASLINVHPDLRNAALMPWIEGVTWEDLFLEPGTFSRETGQNIAAGLLKCLYVLEMNSLAHCNLNGSKVLVNLEGFDVQLVGLEDMYIQGLVRPASLRQWNNGYAAALPEDEAWSSLADRISAAVLLAEILTLHDEKIRWQADGESFFTSDEVGTKCDRYATLHNALTASAGYQAAALFERAWHAARLEQCPSFQEWADVLKVPVAAAPVSALPVAAAVEPVSILAELQKNIEEQRQNLHLPGQASSVQKIQTEDVQARLNQALAALKDRRLEEAEQILMELSQPGAAPAAPAAPAPRRSLPPNHPSKMGEIEDLQLVEFRQGLMGREEILDVFFSPDERWMVVLGGESKVHVMEWNGGSYEENFTLEYFGINACCFSTDSLRCFLGADDDSIMEINLNDESFSGKIKAGGPVYSLQTSGDGQYLYAAVDRSIMRYNLATRQIKDILLTLEEPVTAMAYSADAQLLAVGGSDGQVMLVSPATGQIMMKLESGTETEINCLAFYPGGGAVAAGCGDYRVRVWETTRGGMLYICDSHSDEVNAVAFSPDGMLLASAASDTRVNLWWVSDGSLATTMEDHSDDVNGVSFQPQKNVFATCSSDGKLYLWKIS
jgi:WD40 repeat protein